MTALISEMDTGRSTFFEFGNELLCARSGDAGEDANMVVDDAPWPTTVSCEMVLSVWSNALKATGLEEEYADVLEGFEQGFEQGIPTHRIGDEPWFTPETHTSADKEREDIKEGIQVELMEKQMFGPYTYEEVGKHFDFFQTNPLGAVVNGDGKIQPINNLSFPRHDPLISSVNSYVDKQDFLTMWVDYNIVFNFFAKDEEKYNLALFDWEKVYRQIPTRMSQWRYLMWKDFNGALLLDTPITFGGVAGCGSFGRPADAWKNIMKRSFDGWMIIRS